MFSTSIDSSTPSGSAEKASTRMNFHIRVVLCDLGDSGKLETAAYNMALISYDVGYCLNGCSGVACRLFTGVTVEEGFFSIKERIPVVVILVKGTVIHPEGLDTIAIFSAALPASAVSDAASLEDASLDASTDSAGAAVSWAGVLLSAGEQCCRNCRRLSKNSASRAAIARESAFS